MDRVTREPTIKGLREQLELCRRQAASLDNSASLRAEMTDMSNAIQLLLEFMERKEGLQ